MNHSEMSFSSERRRRIGLSVLGAIAGMIVIILLLNSLGMRHFSRWHLDSEDISILSPMTKSALKSLKQDVHAVVLFKSDSPLFVSIDNLLKEYEDVSSHIKVERVDYTQDPQAAELVKNKYRLSLPALEEKTYFRDLVIFHTEGKSPRVIYEKEFSDYDPSGIINGSEQKIKRSTFKGEMLFTAAIVSLMEDNEKVAYFSSGHREYNPKDDSELTGYSKFAEILTQNNIQIKSLNIWNEKKIPEDCSLLVISGPGDPFMEDEANYIGEYLDRGGRMFLLMPQSRETNLEKLLGKWGVSVTNGIVYDPLSVLNNNLIVTNFNTQSKISQALVNSQMFMPLSREVSKLESKDPAPDAPQVVELLRSSKEGYLMKLSEEGKYVKASPSEKGEELSMAVSVERGALQGIGAGKGTTRIVVTGNADFLDNARIDSAFGNRDFAVLTVNWLLDRTALVGNLGPRPIREYQLNMSQTQIHLLMWIMLFIIPGGVLGVGFVIWMRKRN
ncbi:MAG: GldG family protein [Verrucomicrobia bacterium]|nr:GldG family protein [Verrucomicrobiota bacterium]